MKANFLKQIARALVFGLFVAGFPANLQAASPAPAGTSTPATLVKPANTPASLDLCPGGIDMSKTPAANLASTVAPRGCKNFTVSTCNIDTCVASNLSSNSPTTFDTSGMKTLMGTDFTETNNAIATYQNIAKYLAAALKNYTTVLPNYTQLAVLYGALEQLVLNNLYANPNNATSGVLPFTTTNLNVASNSFPSGDFAPIGNLTNDQKGKLMLGYIQYEYNFMATQDYKNWLLENVTALLLYSTLAKQMTNWAYYAWAWLAFTNKATDTNGVGAQPACPTPTDVLNFINNSSFVDQTKSGAYKPNSQYQFTNGTIPDNVLNLLSTIANAQWSQVNTTDLYNLVMSLDLSAVTSTFSSTNMQGSNAQSLAWVPYMLSVMQAIASNNLYFNCARDMGVSAGDTGAGQGIDGSIYYGINTASASAKLSDEFAVLSGAVSSAAASGATPASGAATPAATTLPAGLSDFVVNYMTGTFYPFLPSSTPATPPTPAKPAVPATATTPAIPAVPASPGNDATVGALDLSGLNGGGVSDMMPGSLWATACANTSSAKVASEQVAILGQIQLVTAQEAPIGVVDGSGAPTMPGKTLQGAAQNLITAAQAAVTQDPFKPYASKYSWVTTASYPPQQPANMVLNGANVTVTPTVLSGFMPQTATDTTSFATKDHLNMLLDVTSIMSNYSTCWNNLCYCANQGAVGGAATAGASCKPSNFFTQTTCAMDIAGMPAKIYSEIKQQFDTPLGAGMMILMGYQLLGGIKGILMNIKGQITAAKDAEIAGVKAWRAKYPDAAKAAGENAPSTDAINQGAADGSGGYNGGGDLPPDSNLPSGPGTNTPGTGTGSTMQPPVEGASFAELQTAINNNIANISSMGSQDLTNMADTLDAAISKIKSGEITDADDIAEIRANAETFNNELASRAEKGGGYDDGDPDPVTIDF